MKSGKYLAGGLIRGTGGQAIKAFMKSDLYKNLKGDMMKKINKLYSSSPVSKGEVRSGFLKGLKKLDVKGQKANIIDKALSYTGPAVQKVPRSIRAGLKRGARNIKKYRKSIDRQADAYMKKGERILKGKKDN
tara:strand:+ start:1193 stop:1591 length:399 start_codon:yes stop_codon:yes gene_type:complete